MANLMTPTAEQREELRHSGFDGSILTDAQVDEAFRRIVEAEALEPAAPRLFGLVGVQPLVSLANAKLLPAPRTRTQYTSDSSPRTATVLYYQLHHAATTSLSAILDLFKPGGRTVSANGAIKDDELVYTVPTNRRAWTSGSDYVDQRSITREVANSAVGGVWPVSNRTFHTIAWDIAQWSREFKRAINRTNVFTHQEIVSRWPGQSYATACPGQLQSRMDELVALAKRYAQALVGAPVSDGGSPVPTSWPFEWHTVVKGDTLTGIARKYHMSLSRLQRLNPTIKDPRLLQIGARVKVAVDQVPIKLVEDGLLGPETYGRWQQVLGMEVTKRGGRDLVRKIQRRINQVRAESGAPLIEVTGTFTGETVLAIQHFVNAPGPRDGKTPKPAAWVRKVQAQLNAGTSSWRA